MTNTVVDGNFFQAPYTCVSSVLSGTASKDSGYASICVAYQENFVITSASPAMASTYGTVFGLA